MDNKAKKTVNNTENQKDLTKIHGVVSHTGIKALASIGLLIITGASGYATYKFIDLKYKSVEEYVGLVFMWIGILVFAYFTVTEIIMKNNFFTAMSELYHYEKGIYYLFLLLGFTFLVTFGVMMYGNVTQTAPLGLEYERHCPLGTTYSKPVKKPSEIN